MQSSYHVDRSSRRCNLEPRNLSTRVIVIVLAYRCMHYSNKAKRLDLTNIDGHSQASTTVTIVVVHPRALPTSRYSQHLQRPSVSTRRTGWHMPCVLHGGGLRSPHGCGNCSVHRAIVDDAPDEGVSDRLVIAFFRPDAQRYFFCGRLTSRHDFSHQHVVAVREWQRELMCD
jgi:hypothetical protein